MDWIGVYGHNIYIDDKLVGYISGNQQDGNGILFISGHKFAILTAEGEITINATKVGLIDNGGDVYFKKNLVGEIDSKNDLRFYGSKLKI